MASRERFARQSLGSLHARIKDSRVLLVGAGGIGCELLKNLALTGFGEIHIVDLDTIDLSNLNRQFLFRKEHIKKPKALVAQESASRFNPDVNIQAHHANIKEPQFNVAWFRSFNLVFNALDNLDARRHVNKLCLAADVPLIESGTTGFNGQVQVIKKGISECYDCNPKETPKSFPVCTIRSTPSQPIHCIVWAKSYLFNELFGTSEDEAAELDFTPDGDNAEEIENLRHESAALKKLRQSASTMEFPRLVFEKVFSDDIHRLLSMEDMWKSRKPPKPLQYDSLKELTASLDAQQVAQQDQRAWRIEESLAVFTDSIWRLSDRFEKGRTESSTSSSAPVITFDKDDMDTLDFVAASANIRSEIFGIEPKSKFEVKKMAGNIIPAIATTNAVTAGLCVLQAFKVMRGELDKAQNVFLVRSVDRIISAEAVRPPNPDCSVCSVTYATLEVDLERATLKDLVEGTLRTELGYGEEFSVSSEVGTLYDPELDDNLPQRLGELDIQADGFLTVVDEAEDQPRVNVVFSIMEKSLPDDSKPIVLPVAVDIPRKPAMANGVANGHQILTNAAAATRKRDADAADLAIHPATKRGKATEAPTDRDDVLVDDSGNGAIMIDDV